jgi:hypothetical protein
MAANPPALTAAEYLRMAEELATMATAIAQNPRINHHFAERLLLLAKQMREDGARLTPGGGGPDAPQR